MTAFGSMPPVDAPLDILSAVSFPDTVPAQEPPRSRDGPSPVYGGLLVYYDGDSASEDKNLQNETASKQQTRTKDMDSKRKRTKRPRAGTDVGEEEAGKKRGRPRVNPTDETASERRRTQIRLAQRAYRLRKESVISSLNQRVAGLEQTIEDMSKTFLAFNDDAMASGVLSSHPELTEQLRHTTERFLKLAKGASPDSADEEAQNVTRSNQELLPQESQHDTPSPSQQPPLGVTSQSGQSSALIARGVNGFSSTPVVAPHNSMPQHAWNSDTVLSQGSDWSFWGSLFNSGVNTLGEQIPRSPTAPPSHSPRAEYTYSFQETTFARRLHRRCVELAYTMMIDPFADASVIKSKFMFSIDHIPRERLANAFLFVLQRKAGEPLEYWNKPYFHIGGAGTHYPRKDEYGNIIYPPNMHPPEKAFALQDEATPSRQDVEKKVEAAGFGGNWFDCHDLEGYISSKGIRLDGTSSYVQLTVPTTRLLGLYSPPSGSRSDTLEAESSPPATISTSVEPPESNNIPLDNALLQPPQHFEQKKAQAYTKESNNLDVSTGGFSELGQLESATRSQGVSTSPGMAGFTTNRSPFMDVDRFIDELTKGAVCLGRAPGFRQADVDAALTSSVCAF